MDILKIIQYNCILQLSRNIKFYVTEEFVKAGYFTKNEKLTKLKIQSKGIDLIAKEIKFNSNIIYNSCLVIKNKNKVGISNVKKFLKNIKQKNNAILFNNPISIKTISGDLSGVKLIWTVDARKALEFSKNYIPTTDILLVNIKWNNIGAFYFFPKESQVRVFNNLGVKKYLKLPKKGTNPRGVEITKKALELLTLDKYAMSIPINWKREEIRYRIYDRWLELWKK